MFGFRPHETTCMHRVHSDHMHAQAAYTNAIVLTPIVVRRGTGASFGHNFHARVPMC